MLVTEHRSQEENMQL